MADKLYPVQIQADNSNANDSQATIMVHVFDIRSEISVINVLRKAYLHVIAWDAIGNKAIEYDNR